MFERVRDGFFLKMGDRGESRCVLKIEKKVFLPTPGLSSFDRMRVGQTDRGMREWEWERHHRFSSPVYKYCVYFYQWSSSMVETETWSMTFQRPNLCCLTVFKYGLMTNILVLTSKSLHGSDKALKGGPKVMGEAAVLEFSACFANKYSNTGHSPTILEAFFDHSLPACVRRFSVRPI